MPDKNKQGRIFLLDRAKAQQTGTFWLSLFQEEKLVRDLVGGQDLSNPGGFTINEGGSVATFNGAQQQNKAIVFPSGFSQGQIIVAARIKATAAQAANPGAAFGIAASAGLQTGIGVGFDASNNVGHAFLDSTGAGLRGYSAGALNTYYTVFAQRLYNSNAYGWINGNPATTSQGAAGGSTGTIDELVIGAQHRSAGYLRQFKGNIEWAALIYLPKAGVNGTDGLMSDEFAKYLYESNYPYSLEAKPSRIFVASAGGGTDTPVNPAVGSIAITGYAPAVAQTANQSIAPNVGNIVITGYAPTISQPQAVNPAVGSLAITGYAPTVTQNVDFPVNPGVGTIAITGYAPTVSQTANQSILPAVGNVAITGYAPAVSQPIAVNPTVGTLAITGYAPTIAQSVGTSVNPDVGSITITGYSPTVAQSASQSLVPDVGLIAITGYAPTVKISSPLGGGRLKYWNGSAWVN